jgi:glycosyltransferase involved in cell wall biosynthesis
MNSRILIVQNSIPHYRVDFYIELSRTYDVTVVHSGYKVFNEKTRVKDIILPITKIGRFYFQNGLIKEYYKDYDYVVVMCDLHWVLNFYPFLMFRRRFKFIMWGSWLNHNKLINLIKVLIARMADANIFYCLQEKIRFLNCGVKQEKLFVANNTVFVKNRPRYYLNTYRFRILFVGTLDKRKELDKIIFAFRDCLPFLKSNIKLTIIGEGEEDTALKLLVNQLSLNDKVDFIGKLTETIQLGKYYNESIVSVSYGQAGLSVLQSFAFGVPFITKWDAISGGEKTNIYDGFNGFFCNNISELSDYLKLLCNDFDFSRELGENAFNFYSKHCTIFEMLNGFESAFNSKMG